MQATRGGEARRPAVEVDGLGKHGQLRRLEVVQPACHLLRVARGDEDEVRASNDYAAAFARKNPDIVYGSCKGQYGVMDLKTMAISRLMLASPSWCAVAPATASIGSSSTSSMRSNAPDR